MIRDDVTQVTPRFHRTAAVTIVLMLWSLATARAQATDEKRLLTVDALFGLRDVGARR